MATTRLMLAVLLAAAAAAVVRAEPAAAACTAEGANDTLAGVACGAPEARRIPRPFPPHSGQDAPRQRQGTDHTLTTLVAGAAATGDGEARFQRSARVLGIDATTSDDVRGDLNRLAASRGAIVLIVASAADALLLQDGIRIAALLRATDKPILIPSTAGVPTAALGYADALAAELAFSDDGAPDFASLQHSEQVGRDAASSVFFVAQGPNLVGADVLRMAMASEQDEVDPRLVVVRNGAEPAVLLADGDGRATLDTVGNYVPLRWTPRDGCIACREHTPAATTLAATVQLPLVRAVVLVGEASPFLRLALDDLARQDYPAARLAFTACFLPGDRQAEYVTQWEAWAEEHGIASAEKILMSEGDSLPQTLAPLVERVGADERLLLHYSLSRLTNSQTLSALVNLGLDSVAPKLTRQRKYWSNFWGSASQIHSAAAGDDEIGYLRSFDYFDIVQGDRRGVWAVPLTFASVLYSGSRAAPALAAALEAMPALDASDYAIWQVSVHMSRALRRAGVFSHVDNTIDFGHLISTENYDASKVNPDMFLVAENPAEWEATYLNSEYANYAAHGFVEGCNDIFKVPMFSPRFSRELIDECEGFGRWSNGDNKDERLQGGYEPVPTQDIHFNQIGFQSAWRHILKTYLRPITGYHYPQYFLEGEKTLDFVVRYRPDKQSFLRPHHDASTVTLNVALNQGGVDYEGGGTRFLRQNCTLKDTAPGWGTLSPGRLTHLHEGLRTTAGTRYILVSFIDQ